VDPRERDADDHELRRAVVGEVRRADPPEVEIGTLDEGPVAVVGKTRHPLAGLRLVDELGGVVGLGAERHDAAIHQAVRRPDHRDARGRRDGHAGR